MGGIGEGGRSGGQKMGDRRRSVTPSQRSVSYAWVHPVPLSHRHSAPCLLSYTCVALQDVKKKERTGDYGFQE